MIGVRCWRGACSMSSGGSPGGRITGSSGDRTTEQLTLPKSYSNEAALDRARNLPKMSFRDRFRAFNPVCLS